MTDVEQKLEQWSHIYDNARYLSVEYRHKEREYGIKWRSVFKDELQLKTDFLISKYDLPNGIPQKQAK